MMTRRSLLISACAVTGCATLPAADPISDDEYELFNLLWRDLECRKENGLDVIVTSTRNIGLHALNAEYSISNEIVKRAIEAKKDKILDQTIDDFFSVNEQSFKINPARIETKCARFLAPEEARAMAQTFSARDIAWREREETQRRIRELQEHGTHREMTEKQRRFIEEIERVMAEARERGEDPEKARSKYLDSLPRSIPYPTRRTLTRFGFNKTRRQAIGVTSDYCGPLCAELSLVIANRTGQGWAISDKYVLLVS